MLFRQKKKINNGNYCCFSRLRDMRICIYKRVRRRRKNKHRTSTKCSNTLKTKDSRETRRYLESQEGLRENIYEIGSYSGALLHSTFSPSFLPKGSASKRNFCMTHSVLIPPSLLSYVSPSFNMLFQKYGLIQPDAQYDCACTAKWCREQENTKA